MKIRIAPETTLAEIQTAFNTAFPYLKIHFFSKPHRAFKGSPAKFLIHDDLVAVSSLSKGSNSGEIDLDPTMPTIDLEKVFEENFGLFVQVFRKSGETWLLTSVTDKLSLEKQNAKGRASEHVHFQTEDPVDYREQE